MATDTTASPRTNTVTSPFPFEIRPATLSDLDVLYQLETESFATDRLSKRRLKHWISAENGILLVAMENEKLLGYCLALLHRGTRLARLYSIAVSKSAQGKGVGRQLLEELEKRASKTGRLFMRLEVAQDNHSAIALYEALGYTAFGTYLDYYDDHRDALRMQKRIRKLPENFNSTPVPWYQQTTDFTCGPAALMMSMKALNPSLKLSQELELDIWREATTIYMTSGHGGCHPIGLALAAKARGFKAKVWINTTNVPFIDSVRSQEKKNILTVVHNHYVQQAKEAHVNVRHGDVTQKHILRWLNKGYLVLALISTYRMDSKKTPHWVTITAIDDKCLYVHDPDPTEGEQRPFDCQHMPIARVDFDKMSLFGSGRLRTAVVISKDED